MKLKVNNLVILKMINKKKEFYSFQGSILLNFWLFNSISMIFKALIMCGMIF